MTTAKRLIVTAASILLGVSIVCAQSQNPPPSIRSTIAVTAATTLDRIRFTAPGTVVQMRLEIYGVNGAKHFDVEIRGGNVIDWHLQNGQAEPLPDGPYLCVVTVKSLSGRITQRIASASVEKATATLQTADASQLTPQQSAAVGPIEDDSSLILLKEDEHLTTTVIAHNGEDGQITRGRGALSFRLGDFFRGKDVEQMRLTVEGNLGIGVANPQARLDVAGAIRASQGIIFPDGSIQFSAARKTFGTPSLREGQSTDKSGEGKGIHPEIAGTGTTGQIPRWLDGPTGVLTDSVISELNGSIGINGIPNPIFKLDVNGHNRFRGSNVSFYLTGTKPGGNEWLFQTVDSDGRLRIYENSTGGGERLSLRQNGNVGIGTSVPNHLLTLGSSEPPVVTGATLGIYSPNASYAIVRDTTHHIEALFGADATSVGGTVGASLFGSMTNHGVDFRTNNTSRMTITPAGNVGIGTGTPAAKLDVVGDVKVSSAGSGLIFPDGTKQTTASIGGGVTGTGTAGIVPMWSGSTSIANSAIAQAGGNVGVGTAAPQDKLHVVGQGVRVEGNSPIIFPRFSLNFTGGGADGKRWQNYAAPNALLFTALSDAEDAETRWLQVNRGTGRDISSVVLPNGNVGIGTDAPTEKLTVEGIVQSASGGFKFPDGSVQTTAANFMSSAERSAVQPPITIPTSPFTSVLQLNLPPGKYLVMATVRFVNNANFIGANNSRNVFCRFGGANDTYPIHLPGLTQVSGSFHSVVDISITSGVTLSCNGDGMGTELQATFRRLTAVKMEGTFVPQ